MKKILAVLLALATVFAFAACGKEEEATTTLNEKDAKIYDDDGEDAEIVTMEEETSTEIVTEVVTNEEGETEIVTEIVTEEAETVTEVVTKDNGKTEVVTKEVTKAPKAPTTKKNILIGYNNAVNTAYNAKAGFKKVRYTDNEKYNDMSATLKPFLSLVEEFIGIGDENKYEETVTKGKWDEDTQRYYLRKSTLTESDIKDAKCEEKGDNFVYTISINDGNSTGTKDKKETNAAVDKCGICVGKEDKGFYDHKSGEVIYAAIGGTYAAAKINEKYTNAKAVAVVNKTTGQLVSLTVTYDISVDIDLGIGSGNATGTTHIEYTDFKF